MGNRASPAALAALAAAEALLAALLAAVLAAEGAAARRERAAALPCLIFLVAGLKSLSVGTTKLTGKPFLPCLP